MSKNPNIINTPNFIPDIVPEDNDITVECKCNDCGFSWKETGDDAPITACPECACPDIDFDIAHAVQDDDQFGHTV